MTPTKFFHDRVVLLLMIINSVITITGVVFILFHLDASKGSAYIIQCRLCDTAAHEFKSGSVLDMSGFILFLLLNFGMSIFIGRRIYTERRYLALSLLTSASILALFAVIVSYSLFSLR
jgi:hypothetical protein